VQVERDQQGPGWGRPPIGAASDEAGGLNGVAASDGSSQV